MNIDEGRLALAKVVDAYGKLVLSDANEADTRRKVIDTIISGVLGWLPDDTKYEERVSEDSLTKYADYVLRTAATGLVVEAKRAGAAFQIPHNRVSGKLDGFLAEGEVGEAIRQARDYARKLSLPFAVVTNGSVWVVFAATRIDGIKFESGQAHIFRSLEDIKGRIVEFWELLSRQRVIEGNLESQFFGPPKPDGEHRLINVLKESGFRMGRNQLYQCIETAVSSAFSDEAILNDADALSHCYVRNSVRVKYDERLKMHLADAKPALGRKVVRPLLNKGAGKILDESLSQAEPQILPQFLLLLGPVGAGKTTFLHYTQKISAAKTLGGKVIWLYVDYKLATPSDNPRAFLYQSILEFIESDKEFFLGDWEKTVHLAYSEEIASLKTGPLALMAKTDPVGFNNRISEKVFLDRTAVEPYVTKILTYIGRQIPIFLVVDNVDQLDNQEYCGLIFIEAQASARRLGANVIMTLRDTTYAKYRNTPIFDAFQLDAIYVDAPSVLPVLSHRFAYAKRLLEGKKATFVAENGGRFIIDDLGAFFDVISKSVLDNPCGYMVEILSGGNVRRCLALVREFLASGHVSTDRALYDYASGAPTFIPPHEFFKGAVFGQRKYYKEEDSLLLNIFDAKLGTRGFQLLRLHLLTRLCTIASSASGEGIEFSSLTNELYKLGLPEQEVRKSVEDLLTGNLIRTADGAAELQTNSILLPTRLGGYVVKELSHEFTYLEACALDAAIHEADEWRSLRELTEAEESTSGINRLNKRRDRVLAFLTYLERIDQNWLVSCQRYKVSGFSEREVIKEVVKPLAEDHFKKVFASAEKSFASRRARLQLARNV